MDGSAIRGPEILPHCVFTPWQAVHEGEGPLPSSAGYVSALPFLTKIPSASDQPFVLGANVPSRNLRQLLTESRFPLTPPVERDHGPRCSATVAAECPKNMVTDDNERQMITDDIIPDQEHTFELALTDRKFNSQGQLLYHPCGELSPNPKEDSDAIYCEVNHKFPHSSLFVGTQVFLSLWHLYYSNKHADRVKQRDLLRNGVLPDYVVWLEATAETGC